MKMIRGKKYLCTKSIEFGVENDKLFTEGLVYLSPEDDHLISDLGGSFCVRMNLINNKFKLS